MKKNFVIWIVFLLILISSGLVYGQNIDGVWRSNQGGTYYIRQIDDHIFWYGESSSNAPAWSNVAFGSITRGQSTFTLRWVDVPKGFTRSHGMLTLQIISNNEIRRVNQTGGFGDNSWRRIRLLK